jgi:hypothetical protein
MNAGQFDSPTAQDWADASLHVTELVNPAGGQRIFRLQKQMVVNGVMHVQFVWLNHGQLKSVGIDSL